MAGNEKIGKWLASRQAGELERLRKLEEEAAEAWLETLSAEQREVFMGLLETHAFWNIRFRSKRRKVAERTGQEEPEAVGFR